MQVSSRQGRMWRQMQKLWYIKTNGGKKFIDIENGFKSVKGQLEESVNLLEEIKDNKSKCDVKIKQLEQEVKTLNTDNQKSY